MEEIAMPSNAIEVVREFWRLMSTNDFYSVGAVFADDYVLDWPQSNERIRGRERFARMNAEYPASGPWVFTIHRLVGCEAEAVSDVGVTDGGSEGKGHLVLHGCRRQDHTPGRVLARAV